MAERWRTTTPGVGPCSRDQDRAPALGADLEPAVRARVEAVCEEGRAFWYRFDADIRQDVWHPFVAADYDSVCAALESLRAPGRRFLEWGSATGVITIVADLMGFDACGIELDASLVRAARDLAERTGSGARFAIGSFVPMGWEWRASSSDSRLGTLGHGPSGYLELGLPLSHFDIVYAYPWPGEEPMMLDLFRLHGHEDGYLLMHSSRGGTGLYRRGCREPVTVFDARPRPSADAGK